MSTAERVERGVRALITSAVVRNASIAEELGLSLVELQILNVLALSGGASTPSAIAASARVPKPTVSRLVRRLADSGYVRTEASPTDRRSTIVRVEEAKLAEVTARFARQQDAVREALAGMGAAEREAVARFFEAMMDEPGASPGQVSDQPS